MFSASDLYFLLVIVLQITVKFIKHGYCSIALSANDRVGVGIKVFATY